MDIASYLSKSVCVVYCHISFSLLILASCTYCMLYRGTNDVWAHAEGAEEATGRGRRRRKSGEESGQSGIGRLCVATAFFLGSLSVSSSLVGHKETWCE